MQDKNSIVNDDLDFNIEEVEQVIAPQIDTGDTGTADEPIDGSEPKDDAGKGDDDPAKSASFSKSRKIFCC